MSIDIALLSKIIGGLLAASTASYGGWVAYDVNNPTFHRLITEQGWVWSPISGDLGVGKSFEEEYGQAVAKMAGDWRCTKQLFVNLNPPSTDTSGKETGNNSIPSKPTDITTSETDNPVGCLAAELGHAPNGKRSGFIKWELALRSGDRGFIYTGFLSINTIKSSGASDSHKRDAATSFSIVFEVKKEQQDWKVGKGFSWGDMLVNNINALGGNTDYVKVSLPNNEYIWEPESTACGDDCFSSENWEYRKWVGFWEQKEGGDKQPTDALFIGKSSQSNNKDWNKKEHKHDVWQTEDFSFEKSNQELESKTVWASSISTWYDDATSKWKEISAGNAQEYLVEIYKPWAKKKGTWTKAEGMCYQSNSRHIGEEESKRLLNFCYQKR